MKSWSWEKYAAVTLMRYAGRFQIPLLLSLSVQYGTTTYIELFIDPPV